MLATRSRRRSILSPIPEAGVAAAGKQLKLDSAGPLAKTYSQRKRIVRLVLSEFEIDVFRIAAAGTFIRPEIVSRRCGLNPHQVEFLSALEHPGVSRKDGILIIGCDVVSGFPFLRCGRIKYAAAFLNQFAHRYLLFTATSRSYHFPIVSL